MDSTFDRVNSPVCYKSCMQVKSALPAFICLSIASFERLGWSPGSGRCICYFHAFTVWQTFIFGNNIDLVAPCELMVTFVNGNLWRHLCIVVHVLFIILWWWTKTMTGVGFEPTHPKILQRWSSALEQLAILPAKSNTGQLLFLLRAYIHCQERPCKYCFLPFAFPWFLHLIENQITRFISKMHASHVCIPITFLSFYCSH